MSFGYIAVAVLNGALRPLLATWHPALAAHESSKAPGVSAAEHEAVWPKSAELRAEINAVRAVLVNYTYLLAEAVQAPSLVQAVKDTERP